MITCPSCEASGVTSSVKPQRVPFRVEWDPEALYELKVDVLVYTCPTVGCGEWTDGDMEEVRDVAVAAEKRRLFLEVGG